MPVSVGHYKHVLYRATGDRQTQSESGRGR